MLKLPNLVIAKRHNVIFNSKITNNNDFKGTKSNDNDANEDDDDIHDDDDNHKNMKFPPLNNKRNQIMYSRTTELINQINLIKKLLFLEIIVIKIQTYIRKYLSKLKVKKMKYYMCLFDKITYNIIDRYIDEISIEYSLDLVIEYIKKYNIQKNLKSIIYNEILIFINDLMQETIDLMMIDIVKEIISHATDIIIINRLVATAII